MAKAIRVSAESPMIPYALGDRDDEGSRFGSKAKMGSTEEEERVKLLDSMSAASLNSSGEDNAECDGEPIERDFGRMATQNQNPTSDMDGKSGGFTI